MRRKVTKAFLHLAEAKRLDFLPSSAGRVFDRRGVFRVGFFAEAGHILQKMI